MISQRAHLQVLEALVDGSTSLSCVGAGFAGDGVLGSVAGSCTVINDDTSYFQLNF